MADEEKVSATKIDGTLVTTPEGTYLISGEKVLPLAKAGEISVKAQEIERAPPVTAAATAPVVMPRPVEYAPLSGWSSEDFAKVDALVEKLLPHRTPEERAAERAKLWADLQKLGHGAKEALHHIWESFHKEEGKKKLEEVVPASETMVTRPTLADWEKRLMEATK
jgi:hypothetical protein